MTRPCKIGVQLPEVERYVPWPEYLDLARLAEASGFDSIWVGDHLLYDLKDGSTRGPYEAWTTLAAIAAVTSGSRSARWWPRRASTRRDARQAGGHRRRHLQGRLIVGLGAGWNQREYAAFGFAYDRRVAASRRRWRSSCRCCATGGRRSTATLLRRRRLRARPAARARGRPADHARLQQPADAGHRPAGRRLLERLVEHLRQLASTGSPRSRPGSTRRCPRAGPSRRRRP